MTPQIPANWDLEAEVVGALFLIEVDTVDGPLRFVLEDEMSFVDRNDNVWMGANLVSMSEIEFSIDGTAPGLTLEMSYTTDMPGANELMVKVQAMGLDAVLDRDCKIYIQYLGDATEFFMDAAGKVLAGVEEPHLLTTRRIKNIGYRADGPNVRALSISVEGPWSLRSRPINGTYSSADQRRRTADNPLGPDPALDVMPTNDYDSQPLFGL